MPTVRKYKIRRITKKRNAHEVTLPTDWLEYHGLKAGDEVVVIANSVVVIAPPNDPKAEEIARKIAEGRI